MISVISGGNGLIGKAVANHLFPFAIPYDLPTRSPAGISAKYDAFIDCARYDCHSDQLDAWEIALDHFKKQGHGRLILFSSIYGHTAPDFTIYPGTEIPEALLEYAIWKGGTEQAVRFLAERFKPWNIQINAIAPGGVLHNHSEEFQRRYRESGGAPMIEVKNLLPVIDALLHPDNAINGQVITVDGGWSL